MLGGLAASVLASKSGVLGGGGGGGGSDSVAMRTEVTQTAGGGPMLTREATDSWIWLVVLAVLAVALFKWK